MTMLLLCLACIATVVVNSQLHRSMDRMQRQRVSAKSQRRSRNK